MAIYFSFIKHKTETGLLFIPVIAFLVLRLLGYDGLYGQDSYEYLRHAVRMKEFILTGVHPGVTIMSSGYSFVAGIFSLVIPAGIAVQLVSLLSLYGLLFFTNKIIKELNNTSPNSLPFLIVGLLLSPYMLRAGILSMSDMLAAFCFSGCVFYGIRYSETHSFNTIFFCVLFGAFCVFVRYAATIPVAVIFIGVGYSWIRKIKLHHLFVLVIPILFILFQYYLEKGSNEFLKHDLLHNWNLTNFFRREFDTVFGYHLYTFPNAFYAIFSFCFPGFFLLNGILLIYILRNVKRYIKSNELVIALAISGYAFFLAGIHYQSDRFLFLTYPLILALLYPAFEFLVNRFRKFQNIIFYSLVFIQLVFFVRAISPSYQLNSFERKTSSQMYEYQNETLYSFDIDIALEGRGLIFDYRNLWKEEYYSFDEGAIVLFNEDKFKMQWEGKNPMINWNNLKNNYQLKLIKELDNGWNLFRIEDEETNN